MVRELASDMAARYSHKHARHLDIDCDNGDLQNTVAELRWKPNWPKGNHSFQGYHQHQASRPYFIALDVSIATNLARLARASQGHSTSRCKEATIKVKTPFSTCTRRQRHILERNECQDTHYLNRQFLAPPLTAVLLSSSSARWIGHGCMCVATERSIPGDCGYDRRDRPSQSGRTSAWSHETAGLADETRMRWCNQRPSPKT
jgi:hypothetical protein